MERVHHVRLSRGLSDEEDENDGLTTFDDSLEENTPPLDDIEEEDEAEGHYEERLEPRDE
jgi:hypothetical protein